MSPALAGGFFTPEPPGKPLELKFECVCECVWGVLSHGQLFATPWIVCHQAPLSMGFPRQEYWSELPFPPARIFLT